MKIPSSLTLADVSITPDPDQMGVVDRLHRGGGGLGAVRSYAASVSSPEVACYSPCLNPRMRVDFVTPSMVLDYAEHGVCSSSPPGIGHLIDNYISVRSPLGENGWPTVTPYMSVREVRDLCLCPPVSEAASTLVGSTVGLHLNLTGWVSTERGWHQDDYLNPDFIYCRYISVWIALENISPESGPFQFYRGSHLWPLMRRDMLFDALSMTEEERADPDWPWKTQDVVSGIFEAEAAARGVEPESWLPSRGEILFWHPALVHRGSPPAVPGTPRRALIAHYSSVVARRDMPDVRVHSSRLVPDGGCYFVLQG